MNKKLLKVLTILLMVVMVACISVSSFALEPGDMAGNTSAQGTTEIQNVGNSVIGILQVVGIVLSVIVLIILGIKYMMGSAEEKAEYKKTMIPYLIGAILVFAASAIAGIIRSIATQGFNSATP